MSVYLSVLIIRRTELLPLSCVFFKWHVVILEICEWLETENKF